MSLPVFVATSHGTDNLRGRDDIRSLVAAVADSLVDVDVREAFVDVQDPRVDHVVLTAGRPCVVVPLLLSPGYHVHHDIAAATAAPQHAAAETMGPDARLAALMVDRLVDAGFQPGDTVVMAAAGSTDERARDATDAAAAQLAELLEAPVSVGHLGGSGEPLADVLAGCRGTGRIALANYLLAAGHFDDMVIAAGVEVRARPLLDGPDVDARLVGVLSDRYADAVRRM